MQNGQAINYLKWLRDLFSDRSGISFVYVTVMLPVIMGFGLLAIDGSRLWSLHSSLQNGADALALAGAAELDRRPDAITRAKAAVNNLVANSSLFADSVAIVDGSAVTVRFFAALPASDADPMPSGPGLDEAVAADNVAARFIEVKVDPVGLTTIFPASFLGASNSAQASASAVAGFDAAVCNFTPMFICNPYEASDNTDFTDATALYDHLNDPAKRKRLINMKQTGGSSAQYFPGNFGFLKPQPPDNPGASELREMVGVDKPPACFIQNGVELRTGAIESIRFGFNVRFDMYDGPMNSSKNDVSYRPAKNVRKGMATDKTTGNGKGTACNPDKLADVNDASKLPRDTCFSTSSCPYLGGRMGDGVWDKATYWQRSHNGASLPSALSGSDISRYDVYKYELATAGDLDIDSNGSPEGGELGKPGCYSGGSGTLTDEPDRRVFHAAVLNCRALDTSSTYGPIQGGSGGALPVVAFVQFFLTEPIPSANAQSDGTDDDRDNTSVSDGDVWAEMIGIDMPGNANNTARDIVQLYR